MPTVILPCCSNHHRQLLTQRIQQTLSSPQCSSVLARLRDEFGADSPVAIDNTITLLFAGFDTTSSSLTFMLGLLAQNPEVLDKVGLRWGLGFRRLEVSSFEWLGGLRTGWQLQPRAQVSGPRGIGTSL